MQSKGSRAVMVCLVAAAAVLAASPVLAQDPAKVAPDAYKCTFENERVRVCEVTIKPGGKVATHSHPDHVVYVMTAGKLAITGADGKTQENPIKPGEVLWTPATTHKAANSGATEIKAVVIELKK